MTFDLEGIHALADFEASARLAMEPDAFDYVAMLREELEIAMALLGTQAPTAITRAHVEQPFPLPSDA